MAKPMRSAEHHPAGRGERGARAEVARFFEADLVSRLQQHARGEIDGLLGAVDDQRRADVRGDGLALVLEFQ